MKTSQEFIRKITIVGLAGTMLLAGCKEAANNNLKDKLESVTEDVAQKDVAQMETEEEAEYETQAASEIDEAAETDAASDTQSGFDTEQAGKSFEEMSDAMVGYLWASLITEAEGDVFNLGEGADLKLTDSDRIRAAVLASGTDGAIDSYFVLQDGKLAEDADSEAEPDSEAGPDYEVFHGMSVAADSVKENCLDLFGEEPDWAALPTEPVCDLFDAVSYTDENGTYALQIEQEIDTEIALQNHECTVTEDDGKIIGEVNMFWGYWGELEMKPGYSNYVITYTLVPSDVSKYGLAITEITVRPKKE